MGISYPRGVWRLLVPPKGHLQRHWQQKKSSCKFYHLSHPAIAKTRMKLAKEAQSQSWELHELRTSSGAADGEVAENIKLLGFRSAKYKQHRHMSCKRRKRSCKKSAGKRKSLSNLRQKYRVLGSRLLAALAFDHRRGIHHNIEDVLEFLPQYFVVNISWYDIVTFLFPGSLQQRGLYNGSWLVCIWRTDFRTHDRRWSKRYFTLWLDKRFG